MNAKELKALREEIALLKEKCELLETVNGTPKKADKKPVFEWETVDRSIVRNEDEEPTGYVLKQKKGKEIRYLFGGYTMRDELRKGRSEETGWFPIKKGDHKGKYWAPARNPCVLTPGQAKELLKGF